MSSEKAACAALPSCILKSIVVALQAARAVAADSASARSRSVPARRRVASRRRWRWTTRGGDAHAQGSPHCRASCAVPMQRACAAAAAASVAWTCLDAAPRCWRQPWCPICCKTAIFRLCLEVSENSRDRRLSPGSTYGEVAKPPASRAPMARRAAWRFLRFDFLAEPSSRGMAGCPSTRSDATTACYGLPKTRP